MTEKAKDTLAVAHKVYYSRLDEVMSVLSDSDNKDICTKLEVIRKKLFVGNI